MCLSRKHQLTNDGDGGSDDLKCDNALHLLSKVFPNFLKTIYKKRILDYGCGLGLQTIVLALNGAEFVVGLDTNPKALIRARSLAGRSTVNDKVAFVPELNHKFYSQFDIVLSQNSMEHFRNPISAVSEMLSVLKPDGKLFVTFGPLWFSPRGSHMGFFTNIPWVNILFSEKTVMKVRANFRDDGAKKYEEVESGLNRMTVARFEEVVRQCGLEMSYKKYECIKGMNFLRHLPPMRELFVNRVSCELVRLRNT